MLGDELEFYFFNYVFFFFLACGDCENKIIGIKKMIIKLHSISQLFLLL